MKIEIVVAIGDAEVATCEEEPSDGELAPWDGEAHDAVIAIGDGDMLFPGEDFSGFETSDCIF